MFISTQSRPAESSSDLHAIACAGAILLAGDFLLWPAQPGLSLAVFNLLVMVILWMRHRTGRVSRIAGLAGAALMASAVATALEVSFSNLLISFILLLVIVGETAFPELRAGWPRWSEALWALAKGPGRWRWVRRVLRELRVEKEQMGHGAKGFLSIVLPSVLLGYIFLKLLTAGNAILDAWMVEAWQQLAAWMPNLELSCGRVLFWLGLATFALAVLRPGAASESPRFWTRSIGALSEPHDLRAAWLRSLLVLGLLNAIYFAANTIDAIFLWTHLHLPAGVSYSSYVHQGVNSLVSAVLLSALVLVIIFQQARSVAGARSLKALGLLWIAQNAMLIASVLLRLKRYVDAYQLTTQRVYVGCFLLLVAAGFALLAFYILREKGWNWLVFHNALATCALFFGLQFCDVARWVAERNVVTWELKADHVLDLEYLDALGSSAWLALIAVAQAADRPAEAAAAREKLRHYQPEARAILETADWRSWQAWQARDARRLVNYARESLD